MDIQKNSLETILLIPFGEAEQIRMSSEMSEMFIKFLFISQDENQKGEVYQALLERSWVLRAMKKRIRHCLTIEVDEGVQMFLLTLVDGNIGGAIMYLYYMQYWAKRNDVKLIDFESFSRMFPNGYPSDQSLAILWDSQKIGSLNMIDNQLAAKSIQFKLQTV